MSKEIRLREVKARKLRRDIAQLKARPMGGRVTANGKLVIQWMR